MRIAVFDHSVTVNNPTGSVMLALLRGLAAEHEFVVFSTALDNPDPGRIAFVPVHVPRRPLALLYVSFHAAARIACRSYVLAHRRDFDLRLTADSNVTGADIVHAHFGHRAFLRNHWRSCRIGGPRSWLRGLDHRLHSLVEPRVLRGARRIVAASRGLAREFEEDLPELGTKLLTIPNPIALERMAAPVTFPREQTRRDLGSVDGDVLLAFVAPGQWERKGLPLLLEALAGTQAPAVRLVVVGGVPDYVTQYRNRTRAMGLGDRVRFVGMQRDVRPFMWAADALVLPSAYEVFPLVCMEAAAAGLPILVTPVHGAVEYLHDGDSALILDRSAAGIRRGMERLLAASPQQRAAMGERARRQVAEFTPERFVTSWRDVLEA